MIMQSGASFFVLFLLAADQLGGQQLDQSAVPDQFAVQPVSVP
jgi:hypothetical protein